jgi:hypothetical protein
MADLDRKWWRIGETVSSSSFTVVGVFLLMIAAFVTNCYRDSEDKTKEHVRSVMPSGTIATIAGTGERATDQVDADGDGLVDESIPADQARFDQPLDMTVGPDGRLYILDWNGHKVRVLDQNGKVGFVAGVGVVGDACESLNPDGTCPATSSQLNHMTDITFDPDRRMVVAAWHNSKIKQVDLNSGLLRDLCGTGDRKFEGDGKRCQDANGKDIVSFDLPVGVLYDGGGNLFIVDQANQVIRRIGIDGTIKTVVGYCPGTPGFGCHDGQGYDGDGGPATMAYLMNNLNQGTDPQGKITMDSTGNLYIADTENNVIRKVVPGPDGIIGEGDPSEEIITTIAGTGIKGYSGDGGLATEAMLNGPRDVKVSPDGTIYIADTENHCIRTVNPVGIISTIAGRCTKAGYAGDSGPASLAVLSSPYGVEVDKVGNLYVADTFNNRIRIIYK